MKSLIFSIMAFNFSAFAVPPNILDHYIINDYHHYLLAEYSRLNGNNDTAGSLYEQFISNSNAPNAYPGYLNLLFEKKEYSKILGLMPKIEEQLKDNLPVQLIFVKTYELSSMHDAADKKILELSARFKENAEVVYYACISQLRNKKIAAALTMAEDFLNQSTHKSNHFIFYYIKAQAHIGLLKYNEARDNIKKCLELNPGFEQGWLLSGLIAELEGKIEQALKGYRTFLELAGHDAAVEQQILNLLVKAQARSISTESHPLEETITHYRNKNYKQALLTVEQYLDQNNTDRQAHLLKLELLCCTNRSKDAVKHIQSLINRKFDEETWYRALHLMYLAKLEQNGIIELLSSLKKEQNNTLARLYLADIYLKKREFSAALELLKNALSDTTQTQLQEKIIYQIALIYYETNQTNRLKEILGKAEAIKTTFAPLLNLLAYHFASKGSDFAKAQKYLDKALKQDTQNIHYLDTQAFIWYKQKEHKKAYTLLDSLLKKSPNDYFILKHMSKILNEQGKTHDALAFLKNAEKNATTDHEKQKIEKLFKQWTSTALTYNEKKQ